LAVLDQVKIDRPGVPVYFGGQFIVAGQRVRFAAVGLAGKEVLGLVVTLFFPIHLRGVEGTLSDIMHGILTGAGVLLFMFPAMGFGATAFGKVFRLYSIGTILIFLVCGALAGMDGPRLAANLPTPWLGVWERINIFGYMLWVVVLAINLLRAQGAALQDNFDRKSDSGMSRT
jgi:hypothetical protein